MTIDAHVSEEVLTMAKTFTPREVDVDGLSAFDTLEAATRPGEKAQVLDVSKLSDLSELKVSRTGSPGHFSIAPRESGLINEWISTRGTTTVHRFTVQVMKAVTHEVKRPK